MMLFGEQLLNNEEDVGVNPQVSERECSKKYALSCHLCLAVTIIAVHFCFHMILYRYTVLDWFLLLSSLLLDYFEDFTSCCFE